ncbi:MAG: CoA transferase subunit A [Flavobacteriaceae bacterium]|nr:CoA transferase subunit A [Flavobacteriaceae bacterium]|tara:strand:+ start:141 stop:839 length:699 start_codon:yes stop_codon:yes gene_type:complete
MITKTIAGISNALEGIQSGMTIMLGGFGLCGIPENLIKAIADSSLRDFTCISANVGVDNFGLGLLFKEKKIKTMIGSYVGENAEFERQMLSDEIEVILTPMGTLAEKCRAAQMGIPAFYTPAGYGTEIAEGKEIRTFNSKNYILEEAYKADFALIKAWKGDYAGNLIFRGTAKNFNSIMSGAAKTTIVEVEELVPAGSLDPNEIHTPGIFVDRIFQGGYYEKKIENLTNRDH